MRKILSFALAGVVLTSLLVSCKKKDSDPGEKIITGYGELTVGSKTYVLSGGYVKRGGGGTTSGFVNNELCFFSEGLRINSQTGAFTSGEGQIINFALRCHTSGIINYDAPHYAFSTLPIPNTFGQSSLYYERLVGGPYPTGSRLVTGGTVKVESHERGYNVTFNCTGDGGAITGYFVGDLVNVTGVPEQGEE